jgi:hypothetical protein
MNERDFDRVARAFMAEGPTQLADRVLDSSLADVHFTRQRRVLVRAPWRTPAMNIYAKLAAAAVVVVAVGALGVWFLSPGSSSTSVAGPPASSPAPSASPTPEPTPEPSATPTSAGGAPPLTGTFTSTQNGISLATPAGWTKQPATEPGPEAWPGGWITFGDPYADFIYDPVKQGNLWLGIDSVPLNAADADAWPNAQISVTECPIAVPVTIDGALGYTGFEFQSTECSVAFVNLGDRGYQIRLYASDDAAVYDRAWFDEMLATVKLHPSDAVD